MPTSTSQPVDIVCPEGDLLLRVKREGNESLLLVSSRVMTKASGSFSKLLQSRHRPMAQPFAFTSPMNELRIPEDDADALLTICKILHGRHHDIPNGLPLDRLRNIASSCNRHLLTDAILPWSSKWLKSALSKAIGSEVYTVIAIAVDLGVSPISAMHDTHWSHKSELRGFTNQDYAGGYHFQKTQLMLKAVAALRNCSLEQYYVSPKCSEGHFACWKTQLEGGGLWPFENAVHNLNLSSLLEVLDGLQVPALVPGCGCQGFNPSLPQLLRSVVCRTLDSVRAVRPLENALTAPSTQRGKISHSLKEHTKHDISKHPPFVPYGNLGAD